MSIKKGLEKELYDFLELIRIGYRKRFIIMEMKITNYKYNKLLKEAKSRGLTCIVSYWWYTDYGPYVWKCTELTTKGKEYINL